MFTLADSLVSQAVKIGILERQVAALETAVDPDRKRQAEAILRCLDEEAANLRPRFTSLERDLLLLGLTRIVDEDGADRVILKNLMEELVAMHVTDEFLKTR